MYEGNGNNYCTCATVLALPSGHSILAGAVYKKRPGNSAARPARAGGGTFRGRGKQTVRGRLRDNQGPSAWQQAKGQAASAQRGNK